MNAPAPRSPYRRRRVIWSIIILTTVFLFYVGTHPDYGSFSLPSSWKDIGLSPSNSRASKVGSATTEDTERRIRVQEIHGLLHFVTAYPDRRLDESDGSIDVLGMGLVKVDPSEKVDLRVFAPEGDDNWTKHLQTLREKHPLVVFSKSYCPYSRRAKNLLASYEISPRPTIVELDLRTDGPIIQGILGRITGRSTVPNVILRDQSIGGSDDIHQLDEDHKLKSILVEAGLTVKRAT
ncbi:thioredoxin-like protein [Panus rudis PR-1116 ss-1]|nr:thioredoxin-like protein [Panus rudis PR-1116 ss-1]